ncbi:MAG: DUF4401 domain-containing protein, partial [Bacteroidota bacterium]
MFGGILASFAFLGFLIVAGLYESEAGMLIFGAGCLGGAIWMNRTSGKIILDTIGVSSFILGFVLIGSGFFLLEPDENMVCIIFILLALGSLRLVRGYVLPFVSVLIVNGSFLALIMINEGFNLVHLYVSFLAVLTTYFFLKEATIISNSKALLRLYKPIRIGLVFSFLSGLISLAVRKALLVP